jgi:hypothetical protein
MIPNVSNGQERLEEGIEQKEAKVAKSGASAGAVQSISHSQ